MIVGVAKGDRIVGMAKGNRVAEEDRLPLTLLGVFLIVVGGHSDRWDEGISAKESVPKDGTRFWFQSCP